MRNKVPNYKSFLGVLAGMLLTTGCATSSWPDAPHNTDQPSHRRLAPPQSTIQLTEIGDRPSQRDQDVGPEELVPGTSPNDLSTISSVEFEERGTGEFIRESAGSKKDSSAGNISLNLVGVEAEEAIFEVLGRALDANYVVETSLQGTVTIQTMRPVNPKTALMLLSSALSNINAKIVEAEGFYRVVAANRSVAGNSKLKLGEEIRLKTLEYASAEEMADMVNSLGQAQVQTRIDRVRNILILEGDADALDGIMELIEAFDVDWLSGMSFAAVEVDYTSPSNIVEELEAIFNSGAAGSISDLARFVPIDRLNVVLLVTPQTQYLDEGKKWIERLDRSGQSAVGRFYVIPIQNRPATEIADILRDMLPTQEGGVRQEAGLAPGSRGRLTVSEAVEENVPERGGAQGYSLDTVRIYADDANNAVVAYASAEQFGSLEEAVRRLDIMPNQVFLEATIAEVRLDDDLAYGLNWFFESNEFDVSFSDATNGAVAPVFPGFNVLFSGGDGRAALSAIAGVTDVKVLSSPSLMVLDNRTATLQVGDQVPIVTQSAVSVTNPDAPIVNSVSLRDTGIILNVTPRVNDGGLVILEIDQEVSDVASTNTSGIDSPTIQQRRITTSVAVRDGESIALGGLIRDRISNNRTKIPVLGDIPVLGRLFTTYEDVNNRTELLVMITPRVVSDTQSAGLLTNEFRRSMQKIREAFEAPSESGT